jgi:hypothetical protein
LPATDFFARIQALLFWQSSLVAHLDPINTVKRLQQLLKSGEQLQLCCVRDGSAKGDLGSVGWELAIGKSILWKCIVPAFGREPGSFCAESHGMLLAMLFLDHHLQFFRVDVSENVEHLFCSNNKGLVLRVGKSMDRSWANPNHCLASECDIESGIVELLHAMPVNFSIQHVLGHQDAKISVENLPWEAQMNCRADACASNCLVDSSEPSKIVPFVPASKASISIDGITIICNTARPIQSAASNPDLKKHVKTKNRWNDWIFNSVD